LLWQLEKSHHLPGGGPNYIYDIHSLGGTRIVRDKVVDVARWGTQDLYNTDTSDVNKLVTTLAFLVFIVLILTWLEMYI